VIYKNRSFFFKPARESRFLLMMKQTRTFYCRHEWRRSERM